MSQVRRTVALLSVAQALNGTSLAVVIAAAPLAGYMLAVDKSLATVPHSVQWLATMAAAAPASFFMQRFGRRAGFMTGAGFNALGGAVAMVAVLTGQFAMLALGAALIGCGNGFAIYYRFAAADVAPLEFRSKAIAWVIGGGVVAGFLGPEIARQSKDLLLPYVFAGCYAAVIAIGLTNMIVVSRLRIPHLSRAERRARGPGRPLFEIVRQPTYLIALASGMVGWGVMVLMMSATPIAMQACGLGFGDTTWVIQWHIVGMFAPSFITGHLIARAGVANVLLAGAVLQASAVVINLSGIEVWNFWLSNLLQGVGWNFLFVGATTLVTRTYRETEKAKAQGFNDLCLYSAAAAGSFASGWLHEVEGWEFVNWFVVPFLAVALTANLWLRMREPRPAAAM